MSNSDDESVNLRKVGVVIGFLAGIAGLLGAWFILPYRVQAAEAKIERLEAEAKTTREILIRIDENVKQLRSEKPVR